MWLVASELESAHLALPASAALPPILFSPGSLPTGFFQTLQSMLTSGPLHGIFLYLELLPL